jgi:hypothetical protein
MALKTFEKELTAKSSSACGMDMSERMPEFAADIVFW